MSTKVYTIEELSKKISNILAGFPVEKAILFGSYAKGYATPKSDVDLVINSQNKIRGFDFFGLRSVLEEKLNKNVDLIEEAHIIKGTKADREVRKTGVIIYGE